ncbi:hypothetical protein ACXYRR_01560 [Mycoplasma sp. 246B]
MLFKNKLFKFLLTNSAIITLITSSCAYLNNEVEKNLKNHSQLNYSMNLLRLEQQNQDISINNSQIFDQFIYDLNQTKKITYFFKEPVLIKSKEEFIQKVVGKINDFYHKYNLNKSINDEQIIKMFETDYLKKLNLDEILSTQNILIYEQSPYSIPSDLEYLVYDESNDLDNIKILKVKPGYYLSVNHNLYSFAKKIFTVLKLPKNKNYKIVGLNDEQIDKYIANLSKKSKYKRDNFIIKDDNFDVYLDVKSLINRIQTNQSIIYKPITFINNLTNEALKDINTSVEYFKISNETEFNEKILIPLFNISEKSHQNKTQQEIKIIFENEFLNAKTIADVLSDMNLYIRIIKEKGDIYHWTYPYQTIKYQTNNKEVVLAEISDRIFSFNSSRLYLYDLPKLDDIKSNLIYEVIQIPKDYSVEFEGILNFKETNDFLVKQK